MERAVRQTDTLEAKEERIVHIRGLGGIVLVALLVLVGAALSFAQYDYGGKPAATGDKAQTQLRTGIDHAKNSAGSQAMAAAVTHLGHVLNCIEGTKGKNFNASWGHVCQGQGDGILVDIKGIKNAEQTMLVLENADTLAQAGVKAKDLATVQVTARGVGALLQVVMDTTK